MPTVMYAPAIQEAMASGDKDKMRAVAREAESYLAQHGDLSAAIEVLKAELAKRGSLRFSGPIVMYGVVIHQAIASGDIEKMKAVAKEAEQHLAEHGDVTSALSVLKGEIAKR